MNSPSISLSASVRQRLLNLCRDRGEDFNLTLTRYAIERFLYRLAQSEYSDRFIIKGATLFTVWRGETYRPTRDLDLLGSGDSSVTALIDLFKEVCIIDVDADGLVFDPDTIRVDDIREEQEYQGLRVQLVSMLGRARISLQVDIGFGDVVTPESEEVEFPTLLEFPAPRLRIYPKETVIAEKLQAMTTLGIANSRMKDFYDIWVLSREFSFDGQLLIKAIQSTFQRRQTPVPDTIPVALTPEFGQEKSKQWKAFISRIDLDIDSGLDGILDDLREFIELPLSAAVTKSDFDATWSPGGPWAKD